MMREAAYFAVSFSFYEGLNVMITFTNKGDYNVITNYLRKLSDYRSERLLQKYAEQGVTLLRSATPERSGKTANSWEYTITRSERVSSITFNNTNINDNVNIALIIQTGHGTGTGGWVEGIDYINPAIEEAFKGLATEAWKEITSFK